LPSQPFPPDAAPIKWRAKGKRIAEGTMVGGIVGPLQDSPVHSELVIGSLVIASENFSVGIHKWRFGD
jgi:hypothetical protein